MNKYEERRDAKVERLKKRIESKKAFAAENDLSLYGEDKSGIPLGQPILVGHHSEKRHRKHLERIERKVRAGYMASREAERLEAQLEGALNRTAIDSDNPLAVELIEKKIERLEKTRIIHKKYNELLKQASNPIEFSEMIKNKFPEIDDPVDFAQKLWGKDAEKKEGVPHWFFVNLGSQINRLKKRLVAVKKLNDNEFKPIIKNGIKIELIESRISITFDEVPNESLRNKLKASPLAFKWAPSVKKWVRKHTPTTNTRYFKQELLKFAQEVENAKPIS